MKCLIALLECRTFYSSYTAANNAELIAAINAANSSTAADTIALAAGTNFSLAEVNNSTNGATGLPTIAANSGGLTILGNGSTIERSAVVGTPAFRLLNVAPQGALNLVNLRLQNGLALGSTFATAFGGAILNAGTLTLDGVTVRNNIAQGAAGYNSSEGFFHNVPGGSATGGGIYSSGVLAMTGCSLLQNDAVGGRGADAFSTPRSEPGNSNPYVGPSAGGNATGGGIYLAGGTASLRNSVFRGNSAIGGKGGINSFVRKGASGAPGQGIGGGLYISSGASALLDTATTGKFSRNTASASDKDIFGNYSLIA